MGLVPVSVGMVVGWLVYLFLALALGVVITLFVKQILGRRSRMLVGA